MMSEKVRSVVMLLMFSCVCASSFQQRAFHLGGTTRADSVYHHRALLADSGVPVNQTTPPKQGGGRGLNPSVVIIVVILTVVFLLSGFLHLLARCCGRVAARREPTESTMSALHGQLQQLFHLHDSGVDQAFIDTLPVFPYKAICGLKEGTDCAVCLSEFESEDRLRLLPKCKHAFHIDCIDTWLLSHSTCPLCRCALLNDDAAPGNGALSDSGRLGSTRSMRSDGYVGDSRRTSNMSRRMIASSSMLAEHGGGSGSDLGKDEDGCMGFGSPEIQPVLDRSESEASVDGSILSVKLGRVERRSNHGISGSSILRGRSYSMGSYEYVVDPANLQVVIAPTPYPGRGNSREFANGARPRHRTVFSDGIPELGSIPGTPADELFWATRGMATPQYGTLRGMDTPEHFFNASTPDVFTARTPDFITSKEEGREGHRFRLNLGHLASEASLVPKEKQQQLQQELQHHDEGSLVEEDEDEDEDEDEEEEAVDRQGNEWVTVDLEESKGDYTVESKSFDRRAMSPLQEVFQEKERESEESRVMAGLERFFGTGWRSNLGLERLAESMAKRDKSPLDAVSNRSRAASEHGGESVKEHSVSSRAFSFRFPVPEGLSKLGRNRRSFSETAALDSKEVASIRIAFEIASKDNSLEAASKAGSKGSKDGGLETGSKDSLGGVDTSSVGSFDSSWMVAPPQAPTVPDIRVNHNENNQQASSLARKTLHWLMGRDRRVQVYASNFSPSTDVADGTHQRNDENL